MGGKFVVKKGDSGEFHFNLVAANGQVIASSETCETRSSAMGGIQPSTGYRRISVIGG